MDFSSFDMGLGIHGLPPLSSQTGLPPSPQKQPPAQPPATTTSNTTNQAQPPARKRGRPRKVYDPNAPAPPPKVKLDEHGNPLPKRPRGRPRKPRTEEELRIYEENRERKRLAKEANPPSGPTILPNGEVKRGRGRPRKIPLPPQNAANPPATAAPAGGASLLQYQQVMPQAGQHQQQIPYQNVIQHSGFHGGLLGQVPQVQVQPVLQQQQQPVQQHQQVGMGVGAPSGGVDGSPAKRGRGRPRKLQQ
ncbi:hypothetical protein HDV05_001019 [Chytridiales sp. JEL 0842]|nr:hypothetical protein HDV05_001019 [Chytridiales sp. JEL 0842]